MRRAEFFEKLNDERVRCTLCPHYCTLSRNQTGLCFGRKNLSGELIAVNYGKILTIADDPIEKKPLYHFHPGSMIISVAQYGCNLRCPFCQNYDISQRYEETAFVPPEGLYNIIRNENRCSVAFTYTEPLMWYEYILDFSERYSKEIDIVIVTNGTINEEPLKRIIPYIKAANIDLKSFNPLFYERELGGSLDAVKRSIRMMHDAGKHLEITHLLIEGKTDAPKELREMVSFIASVSPDIPFHISRYFPNYRYNVPPTSTEGMESFYSEASKRLKYVYTGNVRDGHSDTLCSNCGEKLIERMNYETKVLVGSAVCPKCKEKIPLIL